MYDEQIKRLRCVAEEVADDLDVDPYNAEQRCLVIEQAADAIEELLARVESLQFYADNISKLPDCNTCLKKNICEFVPKYGEYCRINCPAWLGQSLKEE